MAHKLNGRRLRGESLSSYFITVTDLGVSPKHIELNLKKGR